MKSDPIKIYKHPDENASDREKEEYRHLVDAFEEAHESINRNPALNLSDKIALLELLKADLLKQLYTEMGGDGWIPAIPPEAKNGQ